MLDNRKALPIGTLLNFQGNTYELGEEIGCGSNALVYRGSYRDSSEHEQLHHVLIKELFPLHAKGKIFRNTDGSICVGAEAQSDFQMHKRSFEAGTKYHMALVEKYPDLFGANLNNYAMNGTLYSILGVSGGESLAKIQKASTRKLRICVNRILALLDALEIFHANGLAHLDIAPDNIILLGNRNRERVILIDYNSTMSVDRNRPGGAAVFSIKQGYTAPEVHLGRIREIGTATDMYSVTAVFYWMMTGTILTNYQMIRPTPPDVSECVCIKDEPETVKAWVQEILRRGLQSRPARRYQSTEQMRRDLEELLDRIDGFGITHWALWEAGRKQVERMTRENPSLMHIRNSAKLFPSMAADDKGICPTEESIRNAQGSLMLLAGGGMGKTTSLLHLVLSDRPRYSPDRPAIMYLSLYGWQAGDNSYIVHSILDRLHYRKETHTYEDAGKELLDVLDHPIGRSKGKTPVLLLLLDGLNEVTGDPKPLLDEINRFSSMRGVRVVVASRTGEDTLPFPKLCLTELPDDIVREALSKEGLLLPENPDMQELLRTPMMLSMYIQAGKMEQKQVRVNSSEELLKAYLSALKEKAVRDLPEQTERRWQIDAAVDLVLPAIASEIQKKQRGLNNRELLPVVERCYRILGGKLSGRFFPQWIGRTAAIRGTAKTAEEWYGQIIHGILWKQLGLIVRDEQGPILNGEQEKYVVSHQVIEEYLLSRDKENLQKIKRYRRIKTLMVCICCCAVIAFSGAVYKTLLNVEWS